MSSNGFKIRAGPRFPIQGKTGSGYTVPKVNGKPKADGKEPRKLAGFRLVILDQQTNPPPHFNILFGAPELTEINWGQEKSRLGIVEV